MTKSRWLVLGSAGLLSLCQCASEGAGSSGPGLRAGDAGAQSDAVVPASDDARTTPGSDGETSTASDAGAVDGLLPVSFRYEPGWDGVKGVYVHVGAPDAKKWPPAVKLAPDGKAWAGTAMLAPGAYAYTFRADGDPAYPG